MNDLRTTDTTLYDDLHSIIINERSNGIRSVEYERMMMYWHLGERIFVEEQGGQGRAGYGEKLILNL